MLGEKNDMEAIDFSRIWDEYQMEELQGKIENLFPEFDFSLETMFSRIFSGDVLGALAEALGSLIQGVASEVGSVRNILVFLFAQQENRAFKQSYLFF